MSVFEKRSTFPASRDALWSYHANPGALERLVPPWQPTRLLENDGPLRDGKRVVMSMKIGPIWKKWIAEHFDVVAPERFRDRAVAGPFHAWTHSHLMSDAAGGSELIDHVDYELPFGLLGSLGAGHIRGELERMFNFRHARTGHDLRRHALYADRPRLKVAVSGARGAIAANLMPFLTTGGHSIAKLARGGIAAPDDIAWNAETGEIDQSKLATCDALVHLAGQNIAVRWTKRRQAEIRKSRVDATRALCETLARMPVRPPVLIAASAIGFYGDRGEAALDENSPSGNGFVAGVCDAWERATELARDAGIRVVNLRTGVVLAANSGALPKMLTPARLGLAGRIGSGEQWMSWIAMEDIVGLIHQALFDSSMKGPVNAVSGSVRQHEFIETLGHVLHRPTVVPMPAIAVKALLGQMGEEMLLASAKVVPAKLGEAKFDWTLPLLEAALRFELGAERTVSS